MNYIVGLIIIGIIVVICWTGYREEQAWNTFKVEHHCELVRTAPLHRAGKKSVVPAASPTATYVCDDSVSYTRDEY